MVRESAQKNQVLNHLGPWFVFECFSPDKFWVGDDTDEQQVCIANQLTLDQANLVAAAPDLLAACEVALTRFEQDGWPLNPMFNETLATLRNAIAKAKAGA